MRNRRRVPFVSLNTDDSSISRREYSQYLLQYVIRLANHLSIGEPDHAIAKLIEDLLPLKVGCYLLLMDFSVNFYYQSGLRTIKVDDKPVNTILAVEFIT